MTDIAFKLLKIIVGWKARSQNRVIQARGVRKESVSK